MLANCEVIIAWQTENQIMLGKLRSDRCLATDKLKM